MERCNVHRIAMVWNKNNLSHKTNKKNIRSKHIIALKNVALQMFIIGHDFYAYVCFSNNMLHSCFYHEMSLRIGFLVQTKFIAWWIALLIADKAKNMAIVTDCIFLSHKNYASYSRKGICEKSQRSNFNLKDDNFKVDIEINFSCNYL